MYKKAISIVAVAGLVLALAPAAQAAWIAGSTLVQPTGVDADGQWAPSRPMVAAIDGGGMASPDALDTGDLVPATWPSKLTTATGWYNLGYDWYNAGTTGWIEFDLGAEYSLQGFHVWNGQDPENGGTNGVDVKLATGATAPADWSGVSTTKSFEFAKGAGQANTDLGQDYELDSAVTARWVYFDITSSYGDNRHGLSEVRMVTVPEPATMSLLVLGGLAVLRRRRK